MVRPPGSASPAVVFRGANPAWDVVRIPESSHTLAGFRAWVGSAEFPESGRIDAGKVRQVPSARGGDRFIELEGAPDLVVEIVSDASERKDTERLPPRYAKAGVPELWLVDARGGELRFEVRRLVAGAYRRVPPDPARWVASPLLGRIRLTREATPHSGWLNELDIAG